jgi:hypothetical protein
MTGALMTHVADMDLTVPYGYVRRQTEPKSTRSMRTAAYDNSGPAQTEFDVGPEMSLTGRLMVVFPAVV